MTDYDTLIDGETWAFIERTNSWYPPEAVDRTVDEQRQAYDRMCREFFADYPEGVTAADETWDGRDGTRIPVRRYRRDIADPSAIVIYYHGGGFILGGLESHDDICAETCSRTGFEVVSVDYRLAPEHKHPAAFDDALAAFETLAARDERPVLLCGDSAGGNLAAAVSHATRGRPNAPVGQVLIYPGLGGDPTRGSYVEHADAPMLSTKALEFYKDSRADGKDVSGDVTYAPLADSDYSGLPPTAIFSAACDPLSSDGGTYRDRILAAGGKAFWLEEEGLVHGYLRARNSVRRARDSFGRITAAIRALGEDQWPY